MESAKPVVTKETKNKIHVDYEGKLSLKERLLNKVKTSHTWIKIVVNIFRFILMLGVSYVILYPFFARIAKSFMTKEDIFDPTVALIPKHFTLEIYKYLIVENHYFTALLNTLLLSLLCALIQTLVACLIGYGLAKFKFKGNKAVMIAVIVTMIIPHRALKIAMYKHFCFFDVLNVLTWNYDGPIGLIFGDSLNLTNTYWPFIILSLCGLAFKNGLYIYMMRQFFKGVPDELEESAYVDGSGTMRTFFQIIIPLSIPMMITIFLFSFSWQWTDQFYVNLFMPAREFVGSDEGKTFMMPDVYRMPPPSLDLQGTSFEKFASRYNNVIQNTAGMMIIAPLIIVYLFCQKYLVQGIERSGLVG